MLPRLLFGLSQGQPVWEEEGKGALLLSKEEEEGPQSEQPGEIFYVQAGPIRNSAGSHPHPSFPPTPGRGAGPLMGA